MRIDDEKTKQNSGSDEKALIQTVLPVEQILRASGQRKGLRMILVVKRLPIKSNSCDLDLPS